MPRSRRAMLSPWLIFLSAALPASCSDHSQQAPLDIGQADLQRDAGPPPVLYGQPCTADSQCAASLVCLDRICTKHCEKLADCPSVGEQAFDCGEILPGESACYPRRYTTQKYTQGHDCSLDALCSVGYRCMGLPGDADRYCAGKCTQDRDCPPTYRCAAMKIGDAEAEKRCLRRSFCHPCAIDDQCGAGNLCLTDKNGNRFCGQACSLMPVPDAGLPDGGWALSTCPPFATCADQGDGRLQCVHKAGLCYPGFNAEGGGCAPCLQHGWEPTGSATDPYKTIAEDKMCKSDGACVILNRYTKETACVTACEQSSGCGDGKACADFKTSLGGSFCVPVVIDPITGKGTIGTCFP